MASLASAPQEVSAIQAQESALIFPSFTAETAFNLGLALRTKLLQIAPTKPASISISLASSTPPNNSSPNLSSVPHLLFHSVTAPGTTPDNMLWIARKRNTVLRFGCSTWYMHCKFGGDEKAFGEKYGMSEDVSGTYAIHGGGFPVRVKGVEGVVAIVIVSGLKQDEDHMVVVETMGEFLKELK